MTQENIMKRVDAICERAHKSKKESKKYFTELQEMLLCAFESSENTYSVYVNVPCNIIDEIGESLDNICIKLENSFGNRILVNHTDVDIKDGIYCFLLRVG